MCLGMFLLGFILYGTLCFLDLNDYFLMHCGDLNGKEVQKGGDRCICTADSFCCTVETNTL